MSDTTESVTYHLSASVVDGEQWWSAEFDIDLPIDDAGALALATAFASVLPPAPATQVAVTRTDQTTVRARSNFTVDPPIFE
jgi:hypothetical protein